jgi:glycosyltransferase involved in cell wall biosynthesis
MHSAPKPKVTVLVPVYNVERYLSQCLDALCGQTLREIEILCINDGASDGSPTILESYAARDERIRVISKSNSGYGASLNRGLAEARGEYIAIVEPDDFPSKHMLKKLWKAAKRFDADVAKCNFYNYFDGSDHVWYNFAKRDCGKLFNPAEKPRIVCSIPAIWTGMYRRSFLEVKGIRFRETPGAAFQDTGFTLKVWFAAKRATLVVKPLLHYRMDNPGSSSKTTDKVFTVCDELAEVEAFLRARPDRAQAFLPYFTLDKWGKYRWNYERIATTEHQAFAQRMLEEYAAHNQAGELDFSLFEPADAATLKQLLEGGAGQFAAAHPETF